MKDFQIPTREEHARSIRRIWIICLLIAAGIFIGFGGMIAMLFIQNVEMKRIVETSTVCFQIIIAAFATGFSVPYFLDTRSNLYLGIEMSRKGLEVGCKTADNLDTLRQEIKPVMADAKTVIAEIRDLIKEAKEEIAKIKSDGHGKLDRLVAAVEKLAAKADAKADDMLEGVLQEAWGAVPAVEFKDGKCTNCGHVSDNGALHKCPNCNGTVYLDLPSGT